MAEIPEDLASAASASSSFRSLSAETEDPLAEFLSGRGVFANVAEQEEEQKEPQPAPPAPLQLGLLPVEAEEKQSTSTSAATAARGEEAPSSMSIGEFLAGLESLEEKENQELNALSAYIFEPESKYNATSTRPATRPNVAVSREMPVTAALTAEDVGTMQRVVQTLQWTSAETRVVMTAATGKVTPSQRQTVRAWSEQLFPGYPRDIYELWETWIRLILYDLRYSRVRLSDGKTVNKRLTGGTTRSITGSGAGQWLGISAAHSIANARIPQRQQAQKRDGWQAPPDALVESKRGQRITTNVSVELFIWCLALVSTHAPVLSKYENSWPVILLVNNMIVINTAAGNRSKSLKLSLFPGEYRIHDADYRHTLTEWLGLIFGRSITDLYRSYMVTALLHLWSSTLYSEARGMEEEVVEEQPREGEEGETATAEEIDELFTAAEEAAEAAAAESSSASGKRRKTRNTTSSTPKRKRSRAATSSAPKTRVKATPAANTRQKRSEFSGVRQLIRWSVFVQLLNQYFRDVLSTTITARSAKRSPHSMLQLALFYERDDFIAIGLTRDGFTVDGDVDAWNRTNYNRLRESVERFNAAHAPSSTTVRPRSSPERKVRVATSRRLRAQMPLPASLPVASSPKEALTLQWTLVNRGVSFPMQQQQTARQKGQEEKQQEEELVGRTELWKWPRIAIDADWRTHTQWLSLFHMSLTEWPIRALALRESVVGIVSFGATHYVPHSVSSSPSSSSWSRLRLTLGEWISRLYTSTLTTLPASSSLTARSDLPYQVPNGLLLPSGFFIDTTMPSIRTIQWTSLLQTMVSCSSACMFDTFTRFTYSQWITLLYQDHRYWIHQWVHREHLRLGLPLTEDVLSATNTLHSTTHGFHQFYTWLSQYDTGRLSSSPSTASTNTTSFSALINTMKTQWRRTILGTYMSPVNVWGPNMIEVQLSNTGYSLPLPSDVDHLSSSQLQPTQRIYGQCFTFRESSSEREQPVVETKFVASASLSTSAQYRCWQWISTHGLLRYTPSSSSTTTVSSTSENESMRQVLRYGLTWNTSLLTLVRYLLDTLLPPRPFDSDTADSDRTRLVWDGELETLREWIRNEWVQVGRGVSVAFQRYTEFNDGAVASTLSTWYQSMSSSASSDVIIREAKTTPPPPFRIHAPLDISNLEIRFGQARSVGVEAHRLQYRLTSLIPALDVTSSSASSTFVWLDNPKLWRQLRVQLWRKFISEQDPSLKTRILGLNEGIPRRRGDVTEWLGEDVKMYGYNASDYNAFRVIETDEDWKSAWTTWRAGPDRMLFGFTYRLNTDDIRERTERNEFRTSSLASTGSSRATVWACFDIYIPR